MMQAHQTALDFGRARGDLGAERAAAKATRISQFWVEQAIACLRLVAIGFDGKPFIMETARTIVEQRFPRPKGVDGRVWGHVTRHAIRAKIIERVPGEFGQAASSNGSPKPCYRNGVGA